MKNKFLIRFRDQNNIYIKNKKIKKQKKTMDTFMNHNSVGGHGGVV